MLGSDAITLVLFDPVSEASHFLSIFEFPCFSDGGFSPLLFLSFSIETFTFSFRSVLASARFSTLSLSTLSVAALLSFVGFGDNSNSADFSLESVVESIVHSFSVVSTDGDCTTVLQSFSCVEPNASVPFSETVSAGLTSVSGLTSPFVMFSFFSVGPNVSSSVAFSSFPKVSVHVISCFVFLAGFV